MRTERRLPRLFVGSSVEGLGVAYAIQENLEYDAEVTIWRQGIFRPSAAILTALMDATGRFDFAAFVFSADDLVLMRDSIAEAVRDNVIFELGLFMGALGQSRCFFVVPRDVPTLRLPTDIIGIVPLSYRSHREDANLVAGLGTACNQIRRAFWTADPKRDARSNKEAAPFRPATVNEYLVGWNSQEILASRAAIRTVVLDHHSDEANAQRPHLQKVFAFLEGLSAAVSAGEVDEGEAKSAFGSAVLSFWPIAAGLLAPPNHAEDFWSPEPAIAELFARWSGAMERPA